MSNSAVFFVPAAHVAPGLSLSLSLRTHPKRGAGGAPTGALVLLSRLRGATSARVRRGASHDAGRSPLGAPPWRFSAGGRASISGIALPDPCSELLAARSSCRGGVAPAPPSLGLRAAAAGRHSPLRLQDRLRRRPSM